MNNSEQSEDRKQPPKTYIGYSSDHETRYKSSSGGVVTAIITYLFKSSLIETAIGCTFNKGKCLYEPKLVYSVEEYELTGSVYQEMDIIGFIRKNMDKITERVLVVCAPCQVKAVRSLLQRGGKETFIIDYFCSGQTTINGTYCFYRFLGIDKSMVDNIRYRGNGWPNGIEITLKDGSVSKYPNYSEPWKTIHRSRLFRPKRCNYCKMAESEHADVSVGDPWLKEYKANEKVGQSLFLVHSDKGMTLIQSMIESGEVVVKEVDYSLFEASQSNNIRKAQYVDNNRKAIDRIVSLTSKHEYQVCASRNMTTMRMHLRIMGLIERYYRNKGKSAKELLSRLAKKIFQRNRPK